MGATRGEIRRSARECIIDAANRASRTRRFTMANLANAVRLVRDRQLISPAILESAGFNAAGPNRRQRRG